MTALDTVYALCKAGLHASPPEARDTRGSDWPLLPALPHVTLAPYKAPHQGLLEKSHTPAYKPAVSTLFLGICTTTPMTMRHQGQRGEVTCPRTCSQAEGAPWLRRDLAETQTGLASRVLPR